MLQWKFKKSEINGTIKKVYVVVLCSKGYPDQFNKNILIQRLDKIKLKDLNIATMLEQKN